MENLLEILTDTFQDAFKDSIYLLPFLFITYVVMEWIEHKTALATQEKIRNAGRIGPLIGAGLGLIPQCGFSAVAATLYAGRVVTIGTLIAVFLATSDEMLPIFIAKGVPIEQTLAVLGSKFAIGMIVGFVLDALIYAKNLQAKKFTIHEICAQSGCECCKDCNSCKQNREKVYEHFEDEETHSHHHHHTHDKKHRNIVILKSAFVHTAQVMVFIFLVSWAINIAIESIGEDTFRTFMTQNETASIFLSSIFGLIPNCAASVVIADLWVDGALATPAMLSGLLVSSGIGYLVLFKTNRSLTRNLQIIAIMLTSSILSCIIIQFATNI